MTINELARDWYEKFSAYAKDLYPEVDYSPAYCRELAEIGLEVKKLAHERGELILAHYYQRPEIQEVADFVGDSLGLGLKAKELLDMGPARVNETLGRPITATRMCAVRFMGDTVKIVLGGRMPVYMPKFAGCSLVASIYGIKIDFKKTSEEEISRRLLEEKPRVDKIGLWKRANPSGLVLSYMNSDPVTKSKSYAVFTSRNALQVLESAMRDNPGKRVLVMPDKYLTAVILGMAVRKKSEWVRPELVDFFDGACHVHEQKISRTALDEAMDRYPEADLMVHPECGCAADCMVRASAGEIKNRDSYFYSTQEMIWHAMKPGTKGEFIVATESGMVYTLRKSAPGKLFWPVTYNATCEFMKSTTLESLLTSMRAPSQTLYEVTVPEDIRLPALESVERGLKA